MKHQKYLEILKVTLVNVDTCGIAHSFLYGTALYHLYHHNTMLKKIGRYESFPYSHSLTQQQEMGVFTALW